MNAKTVFSAVMTGLLTCAALRGQEVVAPAPVPTDAAPPTVAAQTISHHPSGLSDWITYTRPDCCSHGPVTPLYSELFVRVGPSMPVGGNFLAHNLQTGWTFEGGARGLLFDTDMTQAWTVEAHIVNSNNSGINNGAPVPLSILVPDAATGTTKRANFGSDGIPGVTVRNANRTLVGLGIGKEWYLWEPANAPTNKWRVGVDAGGRYGSGSMTFNEIKHRTDVIGGIWAAAHTDLEVPCGCCFLSFGLRLEWAYTWSDILQRASDVQELNALVSMGVRY